MKITALQLFKCLADDTRLKAMLLIEQEQELCVCELVEALQLSQPKISRHLAQLRNCQLLSDRRQGQWVYYRINEKLEPWVKAIISSSLANNSKTIESCMKRLKKMADRPSNNNSNCC
jgi:ArsR family transcriptional regulator